MDTETSYWDQYDVYDMEQSLPATQPPPLPPPLAPLADEFRYAPHLSSCSVSSQDSYWSRHLGTRPAGTSQQCTPGDAASVRQTPQPIYSSSNLRRLLVVPDKLATLSLDCPTTSFDINASGNSSDSGCDVNEYNVQIVAGSVAEGDDATLVVVTAVTPPSSLELPLNGAKGSSHGVNLCRGIAQPQELKPAALLGRSQSDKRHVEGNESGPKNASLHVANPVAIDDSPPSSPGLCFAGVNANALITRLNFLKDQMDQDELLMSLVV